MAGSLNQATGLPDVEDVLRTGAHVVQRNKKGHWFWTILQMESCLSNKNGQHIKKLETYYFICISKLP